MKNTLYENMDRLEALVLKERTMPAGDVAANIRKRIHDIRTLVIQADAAMQNNRSPEKYFQIIDNIFEDLDYESTRDKS